MQKITLLKSTDKEKAKQMLTVSVPATTSIPPKSIEKDKDKQKLTVPTTMAPLKSNKKDKPKLTVQLESRPQRIRHLLISPQTRLYSFFLNSMISVLDSQPVIAEGIANDS